jgi:hypothetical protein
LAVDAVLADGGTVHVRPIRPDDAEVAFAVADEHQGRGLAPLLLEYLATYAGGDGITRFAAETLIDNRRMLEVFQAAGFRRESRSIEYGVVHLAFDIEPTGDSLAASERRAWTAGVHSIARILQPHSVAVIAGRNPNGIGHSVVRNLIDGGVKGSIYPVNPNVDTLLGLRCSPGPLRRGPRRRTWRRVRRVEVGTTPSC